MFAVIEGNGRCEAITNFIASALTGFVGGMYGIDGMVGM